MTKAELVSKIAAKAEVSQKVAGEVYNAVFETFKEQLAAGETIPVLGFGTFETRVRKAREGRNPMTGEKIQIEEAVVPAFKASRALKDAVKK